MTIYKRFETPQQVLFYDHDGNHWLAGIAWGEHIICGCCGGVIEIAEIYEFAPDNIADPIRPLSWVDISNEIGGDELEISY